MNITDYNQKIINTVQFHTSSFELHSRVKYGNYTNRPGLDWQIKLHR